MSAFRPFLAGLALAAVLPAARAAEFGQVLPEKSAVTFVSKQMGVPVDGRFRKFAAALAFDPARPAQASVRMDVDLASIDTGLKEANDEVVGKPWFDTRAFPSASFVSTAVRPLGGERYEVAGKLSIKGRTQEVSVPATFRQEGGLGVFAGAFAIRRLDFAIGEGIWSDLSAVANEVQIKFHVVAAPHAGAARK